VTGGEGVSERLVLQRLCNRALDAVSLLAEGDSGVRAVGANEWVNQFFDVLDDDAPWAGRSWSVFTPDEVTLLGAVHDRLQDVCQSTPQILVDDDFIAAGWPARIAPLARQAELHVQARGRFSEDAEETEPGRP
jgi:hypothetical protein